MTVLENRCEIALDELRSSRETAPGATLLQQTHEAIFQGMFKNSGNFCDDLNPREDGRAWLLSRALEIENELTQLAKKHSDLRETAHSEHEQRITLVAGQTVKMIAEYHSELMRIKPFPDITGNDFINRTVALTVLEAQIEHCFPAYKHENRQEISAAAYKQALAWSHESALPEKLQNVVKNLAGQPDNVHYLADHKKRHDDGHSH